MSRLQSTQPQAVSNESERYTKTLHNAALAAVVACPILALIPPRKIDLYTLGLVGMTGYSANYIARVRSGRSIWQHVSMSSVPAQEQADQGQELQNARMGMPRLHSQRVSVLEAVNATQGSRDSWKSQRYKEIKEDIEEGKGFGDMIMEQIWEVWNWGKEKDDDDDA